MKKMRFFLVLFLLSIAFSLNGQSYLRALYVNDVATAEALLHPDVNMSYLLAMYLAEAHSLHTETIQFLLDKGAGLDLLIKDLSRPKLVFQTSEVEPSPALLRLVRDEDYVIVDFLSNLAEAGNYGATFYFGSYKNQTLGSNGLLGALLSKKSNASTAFIQHIWQRSLKYYKKGLLMVQKFYMVVALTDDVEALKVYLQDDVIPETFWQAFIDFKALKGLHYLVAINANPLIRLSDGREVLPVDYAREQGFTDIAAILS